MGWRTVPQVGPNQSSMLRIYNTTNSDREGVSRFEYVYQYYFDAFNWERLAISRGAAFGEASMQTQVSLSHEALGTGTRRNIELLSEDQDSITVRLTVEGGRNPLTVAGPSSRRIIVDPIT